MLDLYDTPTTLYRLHNTQGQLLYVGITANLRARFTQHARTKTWWHDVDHSKTILEWCENRGVAEIRESEAVATEGPLHNVLVAYAPLLRPPADDPEVLALSEALGRATLGYRAARAERDEAGKTAMLLALRLLRAEVSPTEVTRLSPFTDSYIRKAAREAGIPPAREPRGVTKPPAE